MPDLESMAVLPPDFSGIVRLFPLPNLVMFPYVVQALHIFEPRYRELLEDAVTGDRLIGMAVLQPGWEQSYQGTPPIASPVCIGRVITHSKRNNGTYDLLLLGLRCARVLKELPLVRMFRQAEVEIIDDHYSSASATERQDLRDKLAERYRRFVPATPVSQQQYAEMLKPDITLAMFTNMIAYTLDFDQATKLRLLGESCVERRATLLCGLLEEMATGEETDCTWFPPPFSEN